MTNKYDIVHVVRCKDCIHYDIDNFKCKKWNKTYKSLNDYCSYGSFINMEAIPVEWIEQFAKVDDVSGSIYRMIEEWRNRNEAD